MQVSFGTDVVIENVDFLLHLGAALYFRSCNNVTIRNCNFSGQHLQTIPQPVIEFDNGCTGNIVIEYNAINGNGALAIQISSISQAAQAIVVTLKSARVGDRLSGLDRSGRGND